MHQKNPTAASKTFSALKLPKDQSKEENHAEVLRINDILAQSIVSGGVVLFEDLDEFIDPSLDQIVSKAVFIRDEVLQINFDSKNIEYNDDFQLFLTTKLANPHYMPEIFIKTTIINFTVTFEGLNEQLLADVVINLEPEVEQQRDALVIEISRIQSEKYFLQSSILDELAESN
jgi:dynein heavy chain, axonemal